MTVLRALLCLIVPIWLTTSAAAQTAPAPSASIEIVGVKETALLTTDALAALPQVEQEISFKTSKGISTARYKGPLLWDVINAAKAIDGLDRNKELAKTLLVIANDDYRIAFSIGEIAPEFGNATILLALETDGQPLKDGLRIVAQGDKRGARAIHDVVRIEIR